MTCGGGHRGHTSPQISTPMMGHGAAVLARARARQQRGQWRRVVPPPLSTFMRHVRFQVHVWFLFVFSEAFKAEISRTYLGFSKLRF